MDAISKLKLKTIKDFNMFLNRANKGYILDYTIILHQISFIQIYQKFDKLDGIYEYLMNN